jgi:hypothetical protein
MLQKIVDNEAISKEAIPAGWVGLFQKAVILNERDLDIILGDVILSVSWDYNDVRDKLTVEEVKDYLIDAFRYLKGTYEVDAVVVLGKGYWKVLYDSLNFANFVEGCFGLEKIIEQVKERWKNRKDIVPWWYQEKLRTFEEYMNAVVSTVIEVCSVVSEIKTVYVRRYRGKLKLCVYLVLFGRPIEYDENDWDEPWEIERLRVKLLRVKRELEEKFPMVDFWWYSYYESELENIKWVKFSDLELVYERGRA